MCIINNKILLDLERLRYPNSGLANVFRNLAKGISLLAPELNVSYFGIEKEIKKISPLIRIVLYKEWHRYLEFFSKGFDIIHVSHQLSRYFQKPYKHTQKILTLHDLNFLYEDISEYKRHKLLNRVNTNLGHTDYLVCISEFVKQDVLQNAALLHLDNLKEITVIHNGISFPENKSYPLNEKFTFLKNRPYLLNIGVLFNKKNQKSLIEALPFLKEDLVLVSSEKKEPYATEVMNTIRLLGLENRVHFFSNISENEKYALLQHCEALCQPSLAEGFGIPPIEAMAFGKPIFLSTYTSLPEIGGDVAFYFESFNPQAMAHTIEQGLKTYYNPTLNYPSRLKERAHQFSYLTMAKEYINLYKRV